MIDENDCWWFSTRFNHVPTFLIIHITFATFSSVNQYLIFASNYCLLKKHNRVYFIFQKIRFFFEIALNVKNHDVELAFFWGVYIDKKQFFRIKINQKTRFIKTKLQIFVCLMFCIDRLVEKNPFENFFFEIFFCEIVF